MRILQLHCSSVRYRPVRREIVAAEDVPDASEVSLRDAVVAFAAVERGDGAAEAREAASQIAASMSGLGCSRLLVYPYAHLSSELAAPGAALGVLRELEAAARGAGLEATRAPFGWTKEYSVEVKGHPLAEAHRVVRPGGERGAGGGSRALASEGRAASRWVVITPDGAEHDAASFDFSGHPKLAALARYEESGRRGEGGPPPHVALMRRLALAGYEPASDQGHVRFYPNGRLVKSLLERYVTERVREYGGYEVETPVMYDSHHPSMESYFHRFPARQYSVDSDGREMFLRFAACFGQFLMAGDMQLSHRNLPCRLYELTRYSFRREQSGELSGMRRLRAFTMPDCHAFCADMGQAVEELGRRFDLSREVLAGAGLGDGDYEMAVRMTEEFYRDHRDVVRGMAARHGRPLLAEVWPERFFYFVLKWEFNYVDPSGRASALSTDQIDVENGARYGISFAAPSGEARSPVILHNSPSGAIERVMYALLEKAAEAARRGGRAALPLWLAPVQARLVPTGPEHLGLCEELAGRLAADSVRADVDDREESVGRRVRDAEREWVPYVLVVGAEEAASGRLSVRDRAAGTTGRMEYGGLVSAVAAASEGRPRAALNGPALVSQRPRVAA